MIRRPPSQQLLDPKPHEVEQYKIVIDYVKHITTLSTGSIVAMTAFLQRLTTNRWKGMIVISLASFMLAIVGSVVLHTSMIVFGPGRKSPFTKLENFLIPASTLLVWIGFILGTLSLSIFVIRNLL
jgi:ABC-type polysaccharide/polyol phosphate export permease